MSMQEDICEAGTQRTRALAKHERQVPLPIFPSFSWLDKWDSEAKRRSECNERCTSNKRELSECRLITRLYFTFVFADLDSFPVYVFLPIFVNG